MLKYCIVVAACNGGAGVMQSATTPNKNIVRSAELLSQRVRPKAVDSYSKRDVSVRNLSFGIASGVFRIANRGLE